VGCGKSQTSADIALPVNYDVTHIPIQLEEMSPPAFRATFPGVAYQLGTVSFTNLNDFASAQIVIGE